jgi:hypothetical protein
VDWYERLRRGEREYLYAVHYDPSTKHRRKCYLGPVGGYVHARTTHPMLSLRGFEVDTEMDWKRRVDYVLELLESFRECDSAEELRRLLENLATYVPRLAKLAAVRGGVAAEHLVSLAARLVEVAGEVAGASRYVRKAVEMLQRLQLQERVEEVEWAKGDEWVEKWRRLAELTPRRLDLEIDCVIRKNKRACEELEELRPEFCKLAEELELNLVFCQKNGIRRAA